MNTIQKNTRNLTRFAWLSVGAALLTIALKAGAYWLTGSVGLLSDALESGVNLVGALMALAMLSVAARPADEEHAFGHDKAEYFSSGAEGGLILFAAISIAVTAIERLHHPKPLEQLGLGLAISVLASMVNLGVALVLRRAARCYDSITLQADSKHLMTDVITSGGVLAGVGAVALTKWQPLDSIAALVVAANILWMGYSILRDSVRGLMDTAIPENEMQAVLHVLESYLEQGVHFHALRTRQAGSRRFVSVHVLVPGEWTVQRGHDLVEEVEQAISRVIARVTVITHLEPLEDRASYDDLVLERVPPRTPGGKAADGTRGV